MSISAAVTRRVSTAGDAARARFGAAGAAGVGTTVVSPRAGALKPMLKRMSSMRLSAAEDMMIREIFVLFDSRLGLTCRIRIVS